MIQVKHLHKQDGWYNILHKTFINVLLIYILSSCSVTSISPQNNNQNENSPGFGYPTNTESLQQGYPVGEGINNNFPNRQAHTPVSPKYAPVPEPGMAAISGSMYSLSVLSNLPNTVIYLTPAVGSEQTDFPNILAGPDVSKGDLPGKTDEQGLFSFNSVPPGNYFLVIYLGSYWSIASASAEELTEKLITLHIDDRIDLGVVYVP